MATEKHTPRLSVVSSHNTGEQPASTPAAPTAGSADPDQRSGHVALLEVDADTGEELAAQLAGRISFDRMTDTQQLLDELEQLDVVVLGLRVREPVRLAQRIKSAGNDLPVMILTEPERHERLRQVLRFSPFIGSDVTPWPVDHMDELANALGEAVLRVQKRRSYSGVIAASQSRMRDIHTGKPPVSRYLDRLLDNAPIGVLNVDVQGVILGMNRYAGQMLNITERDALGVTLGSIFSRTESSKLHELVARCVAPSKRPAPAVVDVSESVGSSRYVEVVASSLVDRTGQLGATLILQDVTGRVSAEKERLEVEDALRVSERRYRELVQTMSEALALTDEQHVITYVNESFSRIFGYSSEEVVGRHLLEFVHQEDKTEMGERMSAPADNPIKRYETAWVTKDGRKIITLTSPKRIYDPDEGYLGCLGIFTDITERKQIEEREKKHMLELAHVSRVTTMGELSSQIAHELAQPLAAIAGLSTGCLKLFKAGAAGHDDIEESLADISQQASRAREIVIRLRNFVRNEDVQHSRVVVNELIRTVIPLIDIEARWFSLPIKLDLSEPLPDITGDRVLLEQVVLNLVHNAIEAMQANKQKRRRLTIRTTIADPKFIRVTVSDSGPGISKELIAKVFDPFFTTKPDGMGMGLAITRSIIDAHGGKLEADNNAQGGAIFGFTLPVSGRE